MSAFTVFGAAGFIGRHLVAYLQRKGHEVTTATRGNWPPTGSHMGHIIFAIGMTANFRGRPHETTEAHVTALDRVLRNYTFDSFLYFSSTRIYLNSKSGHETSSIQVDPLDKDQIYNITKLAGECLCMSTKQQNVRVIRLSNVIGLDAPPENFLPSLIKDAINKGEVTLHLSEESAKDYIDITDVCPAVENIALRAGLNVYNLASGRLTTNADLARTLHKFTGAKFSFAAGSPAISFPQIDISRLREEFAFLPLEFEASIQRILPR